MIKDCHSVESKIYASIAGREILSAESVYRKSFEGRREPLLYVNTWH